MDRVSWGLRKLAGLGPESSPPDAQLLALHNLGDPDALVLILERHGASIWRVCRARLPEADADDAFQATVVSFIRGAKSIRSPELLGAWLVRVAALTSRKALSRRRGESLAVEPPATRRGPAESAADREVVAKVIAEVARLPAKARAIVTLCVLEGQTAREAARVLGVPVGTADTRLAAAKALLRKRLTRLGLAPSLVILLADPLATAGAVRHAARLAELAPTLVRGASPAILALTITGGITMTTAKILTALAIVGVGAGAAGWGVWRAGAEDKPKVVAEGKGAAEPAVSQPAKLESQPPPAKPQPPTTTEEAAETRYKLSQPSGVNNLQNLTLETLFAILLEQHNVYIRFDFEALNRYRGIAAYEQMKAPDVKLSELRVKSTLAGDRMSLRDVLADVLATGFPDAPLSLSVRGNQVLIGPAYRPLSVPGVASRTGGNDLIERNILIEMTNGPPVSAEFRRESFYEVIETLRAKTGANIVVKLPKDGAETNSPIMATFSDVRLATALEIIGDMVGLRLVVVGNVFYLTDAASAERLQEKVSREMYGIVPTK